MAEEPRVTHVLKAAEVRYCVHVAPKHIKCAFTVFGPNGKPIGDQKIVEADIEEPMTNEEGFIMIQEYLLEHSSCIDQDTKLVFTKISTQDFADSE